MAQIAYRARSMQGRIVEGRIRAADAAGARARLWSRGLEPLDLDAPGKPAAAARTAAPRSPGGRVRSRDLRWMTGQLALMLEAGTSLADSLDALARQREGERIGEMLGEVNRAVRGGEQFGEALAAHPRVFDHFYVSAIRAGETGGAMAAALARLERHLHKREKLLASIRTALIYPTVLFAISIAAVTFMIAFVMPRFITLFENNGVALPMATRALIAVTGAIHAHWPAALAFAAAAALAAGFLRRSPAARSAFNRFTLRAPIAGPLARGAQSATLFRIMATLLESGAPLVETLGVARDACRPGDFRQGIGRATAGVIRGEGLAENLARTGLFDVSVNQMVQTGEETGSLARVMSRLADHLEESTEERLRRLTTLFEPLVIILMGGAIGFIAVALLLPIFKLSTAVGGG